LRVGFSIVATGAAAAAMAAEMAEKQQQWRQHASRCAGKPAAGYSNQVPCSPVQPGAGDKHSCGHSKRNSGDQEAHKPGDLRAERQAHRAGRRAHGRLRRELQPICGPHSRSPSSLQLVGGWVVSRCCQQHVQTSGATCACLPHIGLDVDNHGCSHDCTHVDGGVEPDMRQ
jgi:hypothetical protein